MLRYSRSKTPTRLNNEDTKNRKEALDGKTPLITACEEGQIELVTFMYQNPEKFDFSVRNEENLEPLEILVKYCEDPTLKIKSKAFFAYVWLTHISYFVHQESGFAKLMETFGPQIWNAIVMTKSKFEALKLKNFI